MADFSEIDINECESIALNPGEALTESRTVILQSVLNAIKKHGRSSMHAEVCGVLVGRLCKDKDSPYLLIDGRIEGKYASHQSGSVTFTSETWTYINDQLSEQFPEERIVGWYHTHPGFGIFLSNMDAFIHQNFFSLKWQCAYVFDPQAETDGFFYNDGSNLNQENVFVRSDVPEDKVAPRGKTAADTIVLSEEEERIRTSSRFGFVVLTMFSLCILIGLGASIFVGRSIIGKLEKKIAENEAVLTKLSEQQRANEASVALLGDNQRLLGQKVVAQSDEQTGLEKKVVDLEDKVARQGEEQKALEKKEVSLETEVVKLGGGQRSLEKDVGALESKVGVQEKGQKALELKVSGLESKVGVQGDECKTLLQRVNENATKICALDDSIKLLRQGKTLGTGKTPDGDYTRPEQTQNENKSPVAASGDDKKHLKSSAAKSLRLYLFGEED